MGIRELREVLKDFGNNNWYRLKKEYTSLKFPLDTSNKLSIIKNELLDFQPFILLGSGEDSFTYQFKNI